MQIYLFLVVLVRFALLLLKRYMLCEPDGGGIDSACRDYFLGEPLQFVSGSDSNFVFMLHMTGTQRVD
jgi:hypothetical protein